MTHLETHAVRSKTVLLNRWSIDHPSLCVRRRPPQMWCWRAYFPPFWNLLTESHNIAKQMNMPLILFFLCHLSRFSNAFYCVRQIILSLKVLTRSSGRHAFWGLVFSNSVACYHLLFFGPKEKWIVCCFLYQVWMKLRIPFSQSIRLRGWNESGGHYSKKGYS